MDKEALEKLIESYKEDLVEAVANRDAIAQEDLESKVEEKLAEKKEEIKESVYGDHNKRLADADKTVELMEIIINKRENQLAQMIVEQENTEQSNL